MNFCLKKEEEEKKQQNKIEEEKAERKKKEKKRKTRRKVLKVPMLGFDPSPPESQAGILPNDTTSANKKATQTCTCRGKGRQQVLLVVLLVHTHRCVSTMAGQRAAPV